MTVYSGNSTVNTFISSSTLYYNSTVGGWASIAKSSTNGFSFAIGSVGGNNASNPFWSGCHWTPPQIYLANGSPCFPRTVDFYSYTTASAPSDMYFNRFAGNDSGLGTGLRFYASGTDGGLRGLDIAANGNIGVGTTSPGAKLEVAGGAKFRSNSSYSPNIELFNTAGDTTGPYVSLYKSRASTTTTLNGDSLGSFKVHGTDTSNSLRWAASIDINQDGAAGSTFVPGRIAFNTTDTSGNISERMRIDALGNVGINETSPSSFSKLTVYGAITAGSLTSTGGSTILRGYYGSGAITTFGTEYSTGGPVIGYGVTPSTSAADSFVSSGPLSLARAAYTQSGNIHKWYSDANQTVAVGSAVTCTERMRLNASGFLGIGSSNPQQRLEIVGLINSTDGSGTNRTFIGWQSGSSYSGTGLHLINIDNSALMFGTNNTVRGFFDVNGGFFMGTMASYSRYLTRTHSDSTSASNEVGMYMDSNGRAVFHNSDGGGTADALSLYTSWGGSPGSVIAREVFRVLGNGNVQNVNSSYGSISDISLKENIVDATPKLAELMQVKIRNFNFKHDSNKTKLIGVIAQELEQIFPGLIDEDEDGIKGVKYSVFVPMLIKAVQELSAKLDEATDRISILENK